MEQNVDRKKREKLSRLLVLDVIWNLADDAQLATEEAIAGRIEERVDQEMFHTGYPLGLLEFLDVEEGELFSLDVETGAYTLTTDGKKRLLKSADDIRLMKECFPPLGYGHEESEAETVEVDVSELPS